MAGRGILVGGLAVMSWSVWAQSTFEVASVRPANPEQHVIGLFTWPGGRITATRYTLKMLMQEAYGVKPFQILGGPRWIDTDLFDVVAKPAANSEASKFSPANFKAPPSKEMLLMLQAL